MVERICPVCRHSNPLENQYCGACGAALTGNNALTPREPSALAPRNFLLSSAQMRQLGAALALGAATLAFEAGKAWLRRRIGTSAAATPISTITNTPITVPMVEESSIKVTTTIVSQRVVEIWERGELVRQVVERHIWRQE